MPRRIVRKYGPTVLVIAVLAALAWVAFDDERQIDDRDDPWPATPDTLESEFQAEGPTLVAQDPRGFRPAVPTPNAGAEHVSPPEAPPAVEPAGRIVTGLVLVDGRPVSGGSIRMQAPHRPLTGDAAPGATIEIGPDGSFRIEGVRWAGLVLYVSVDGMQPRVVHVAGEENQRINLARGSGSIWGVAYDALGRPAEGALIRLATGGNALQILSNADLDGRYEFRDLAAGEFIIIGHVAPETPGDARNIRSNKASLEDGERRRLDLGGPHEDALWSGVIRYVDGVQAKRAGNVFLQSVDGERRMYVSIDTEGRFSERVPPGTYQMEFVLRGNTGMFSGARLVQTSQTLVVGDRGLVEDLTFPGTRVSGRLDGHQEELGQTLDFERQAAEEQTGEATPAPSLIGSQGQGVITVGVAADGSYLVDGLLPGTYAVSGRPRALRGAERGAVSLEVPPGRAHIGLELALEP